MLGVYINPGRRPDQPEPTPQEWGDRTTNRPAEYNTPDDKYARIICGELLPDLKKREYNVSPNPDHRGIGGVSSGAIAAFMVAWERPDEFRKVLSIVGSFVNLGNRGGHTYPNLVLQSERKPIRVFLQDGRNDNRGGRGADPNERDWFYQNVRLVDALMQGERCVCDLASLVGMTESAVSHQLRLLRGARLVRVRRAGRLAFYSLDDHHVAGLVHDTRRHVEEHS